MGRRNLHIMMYPWFALGHLTAFLRLSNKLAQRGHKISFFLPPSTIVKLSPLNLHPNLIALIPVAVPAVAGLPTGAETTCDVPFPLQPLIMTAMDRTQPHIELSLTSLKPDLVFFDFTHWLPSLARRLRIKSVHYCSMSPASVAYLLVPNRQEDENNYTRDTTKRKLMEQPPGFPANSAVKLKPFEADALSFFEHVEFGEGVSLHKRTVISLTECDAIAFRTSYEMEGQFCDYVAEQFGKPVLLTGPVIPEPPNNKLEEKWVEWLGRFESGSVVYCSFGSECRLERRQFEEVLWGLEMTKRPFLVALKAAQGAETAEEAVPEGFRERVEGRGVVHGGWVQQELILRHGSVGCFVTHCGSGSVMEGVASECGMVLVPQIGDQFVNARVVGGEWGMGVEVERGEGDGWWGRESLCRAVEVVMGESGEVGEEIKRNHRKWREFLLGEGLEGAYVDGFVEKLHDMVA